MAKSSDSASKPLMALVLWLGMKKLTALYGRQPLTFKGGFLPKSAISAWIGTAVCLGTATSQYFSFSAMWWFVNMYPCGLMMLPVPDHWSSSFWPWQSNPTMARGLIALSVGSGTFGQRALVVVVFSKNQ